MVPAVPAVPTGALLFLAFLTVELTLIYLAVVLLVELLQQRLGPARIRDLLGDRSGPVQFLAAAALGAVTPFCSCSTVPVVAGMNKAGVPWPTLASFLVVSPLVNPALFTLMWTFVGATYAGLYVLASLLVAVAVGAAVALAGRAGLWDVDATREAAVLGPAQPTWDPRGAARDALTSTWSMFPVFLAAGVLGAALKFWIGTAWIHDVVAGTGWWGVPLAAVVGVPVYASTAVLLPLGALLLEQGVNLGIVTAFLMGATGFSIPEGVMLKEIIGTRRLAILGAAFVPAVVGIGYGFQVLVP